MQPVLALLKALRGREAGGHIHNNKGVSCALVLTIRELRKLICSSKTKQRGRLMGVLYPFLPFFLLASHAKRLMAWNLYMHIRGAFSVARFGEQGNAKAYELWNEQQDWLHVFLCLYANFLSSNRQEGAIGKKMIYMKIFFTLRLMLVSFLAAMSMVVNAKVVISYSTDDGFKYYLEEATRTATVANYSGSATELIIPDNVIYMGVKYSVTELDSYCFKANSSLSSIDIPSSVTSLGYGCFWDCSSLTSITIPSSVTNIDDWCFHGCSSLTSINIPSLVTSLGYACLDGCSSLTSIDIPPSVTSLGDCCFLRCSSLKTINIPSSVKSFGESCFYGCSSLTSIDIPSSVTSLGEMCFSDCTSLTSISIPSSVKSLGANCFQLCTSLTSINIPSSVTSFGDYCFNSCF